MNLLNQILYFLRPFLMNGLPVIAVLIFTAGAFNFFFRLVQKYIMTDEYVELKKPGILFIISLVISVLIFYLSLLAINIPPVGVE